MFDLHNLTQLADSFHFGIATLVAVTGLTHLLANIKSICRIFVCRHLRKAWGFKDGDYVTIVCSELEEQDIMQYPEPREYIYTRKYGDIDALFEVSLTLLKLYPDIKLKISSSKELDNTQYDQFQNFVLIGGPDYNIYTERFLSETDVVYNYKTLTHEHRPQEEIIALCNTRNKTTLYSEEEEHDYGYFERRPNPHDPRKSIVCIGGCHTIGVTAAAKAFSVANNTQGKPPGRVLNNAKIVSHFISRTASYAVLIYATKHGQTILTPTVTSKDVTCDLR